MLALLVFLPRKYRAALSPQRGSLAHSARSSGRIALFVAEEAVSIPLARGGGFDPPCKGLRRRGRTRCWGGVACFYYFLKW